MLGLINGITADDGEYLNQFRINDAGRAMLAAGAGQEAS